MAAACGRMEGDRTSSRSYEGINRQEIKQGGYFRLIIKHVLFFFLREDSE